MSKVQCNDEKTLFDEVQGESGSNVADSEEVLPAPGTRERAMAEKETRYKAVTHNLHHFHYELY